MPYHSSINDEITLPLSSSDSATNLTFTPLEPDALSVETVKKDPTKKATDLLINSLMQQKKMHVERNKTQLESKRNVSMQRKRKLEPKVTKRRKFENSAKVKIAKKPKLEQSMPEKGSGTKFGHLTMTPLQSYHIPSYIVDIERNIDKSRLSEIEKHVKDSKYESAAYIRAFTAMLHLSEIAESIFLKDFDQKRVRVTHSGVGTIFQIAISDKLKSAVDESIVDHFTIQSSAGFRPTVMASGQITRCDKEFIYMKMGEDDSHHLIKMCEPQRFDISFHINRTSFQMQHKALEFVQNHELYATLINNIEYNAFELEWNGTPSNDYTPKGELFEKLNEEQKIAVKSIVTSDNLLPYLLFGPAGKSQIEKK